MRSTNIPDNVIKKAFDESPTELIMDPKHPGINDKEYCQRRQMFFNISREYRLQNKGMPKLNYTEVEHDVWRQITTRLQAAHEDKACKIYLNGKRELGIDGTHMPDQRILSERLYAQHGMSLIPAEGLLATRDFHRYLYNGVMPCTQFIRHASNPEYTPEPDAVHDVLGHLPPLMDKEYAHLTHLIGRGVNMASETQLLAWDRIYWFTIEFGLIQESDKTKVFGAGILSSFGEMEFCFSDDVERRPLDIKEIIVAEYDPTQMQKLLFVIPSLVELNRQLLWLITEFEAGKSIQAISEES